MKSKMVEKSGNVVVEKYFSKWGDPYGEGPFDYKPRDAVVKNDAGEVIETVKGVVFPSFWSENASNTVATKYFRKEGVPETGRETDIRQLAGRVARTIAG